MPEFCDQKKGGKKQAIKFFKNLLFLSVSCSLLSIITFPALDAAICGSDAAAAASEDSERPPRPPTDMVAAAPFRSVMSGGGSCGGCCCGG